MASFPRQNNRVKHHGWGLGGDDEAYSVPSCPTYVSFDNDVFRFDEMCHFFNLGTRIPLSFDSTLMDFSGTTATFDEE